MMKQQKNIFTSNRTNYQWYSKKLVAARWGLIDKYFPLWHWTFRFGHWSQIARSENDFSTFRIRIDQTSGFKFFPVIIKRGAKASSPNALFGAEWLIKRHFNSSKTCSMPQSASEEIRSDAIQSTSASAVKRDVFKSSPERGERGRCGIEKPFLFDQRCLTTTDADADANKRSNCQYNYRHENTSK